MTQFPSDLSHDVRQKLNCYKLRASARRFISAAQTPKSSQSTCAKSIINNLMSQGHKASPRCTSCWVLMSLCDWPACIFSSANMCSLSTAPVCSPNIKLAKLTVLKGGGPASRGSPVYMLVCPAGFQDNTRPADTKKRQPSSLNMK